MTEVQVGARRRGLVAACLSLLAPGVGHAYAGRLGRGVVLLVLVLLALLAPLTFTSFEPSKRVLYMLGGAVALTLSLYLLGIIDAFRVARRAPRPFPLRGWNHPAVYLVMIAFVYGVSFAARVTLTTYAFEVYLVPTASMEPGVPSMSRIVVNKQAVTNPARGDVILFRSPMNARGVLVKRVIGFGGETVELKDQRVLINGKPLEDDHADWRAWRPSSEANGPFEVPAGHLFVLGDNRGFSSDSRRWGPLPMAQVIGTAQYVLGDDVRVIR